jgi:hypothetical protein
MMYGGTLSARRSPPRDDLSFEIQAIHLDQRLPVSAPGCTPGAAATLAQLGVLPGRYSGAEQIVASGTPSMAASIEPASCTILSTGALTIASRATGEVTTFTWTCDRWRWSPHSGLTVEARPRRVGAILVIDFVAWERQQAAPVARLYLATDSTS